MGREASRRVCCIGVAVIDRSVALLGLKELVAHRKLAPGTTVYQEVCCRVGDQMRSTIHEQTSKRYGITRFVFRCEDIRKPKPAVSQKDLKERLLKKLGCVAREVVVN